MDHDNLSASWVAMTPLFRSLLDFQTFNQAMTHGSLVAQNYDACSVFGILPWKVAAVTWPGWWRLLRIERSVHCILGGLELCGLPQQQVCTFLKRSMCFLFMGGPFPLNIRPKRSREPFAQWPKGWIEFKGSIVLQKIENVWKEAVQRVTFQAAKCACQA